MNEKVCRKIDGSGIFILVRDNQKLYTILFSNIRRNGLNFQDAGGYLDAHLDYQTNACKELLEESCCSLIIDPQNLVQENSVIVDHRYISFFIFMDANILSLRQELTEMYNQNRRLITQIYKQTKDRNLRCFNETNMVIIHDLNEIIQMIKFQPDKQIAYLNLNGKYTELHQRTQNIIIEYLSKKIQFQPIYKYNKKRLTVQQTNCKQLIGKYYISIEEQFCNPIAINVNYNVNGSGIIIFIKDQEDLYLILFIKNINQQQYIMDAGGDYIDQLMITNAIQKLNEDSCGVFQIQQSVILDQFSVITDNRYRSYFVTVNMCPQLTKLKVLFFNNLEILQNYDDKNESQNQNYSYTQDLILVEVDYLNLNLAKQNYDLVINNKYIPLHSRTIQVIEKIKEINYFNAQKQIKEISLQHLRNDRFPQLNGQLAYQIS